jgi:tetratricopeptide (TPR) repeat protein
MSTVLRQASFPDETENYEAFELMTEALELLDRYVALTEPQKEDARHKRSDNESLLLQAEDALLKALEIDSTYSKAKYFLAITYYLSKNFDSAIRAFNIMLETTRAAGSFAEEIWYNRAAAYSEAGNFDEAITGFTRVINSRKADTEIKLLARAARTLTRAEYISKGEADDVKVETRQVKDDYYRVLKELRFNFFRRLLGRSGRVDGEVAEKIKGIVTAARVEIGMPSRRWLIWVLWIFIVLVMLFIMFYVWNEYRIVFPR